ncbi:hypothetical protein HAX54_028362, partial [Datura stramonium]|nr:hypothetical protein [Datura stramonium]
NASCTHTMSAECEERWGHAHVGRVRGSLAAFPCQPSTRDVRGHAMLGECKGRWGHANVVRVRGT